MKAGDKITVLDPEVVPGVVTVGSFRMQGSVLFRWGRTGVFGDNHAIGTAFNAVLDEADEGRTWARGWKGEEADALKVVDALR